MTLHNHTLKLLRNRPRSLTLSKIAKETELNQNWLEKYNQGKINKPSSDTVQKLYEYLSGRKLLNDAE